MKSTFKILFGYLGLLSSGILFMDMFSYSGLLGGDIMHIFSREYNVWLLYVITLPFTLYCAIRFFVIEEMLNR